MNGSHCTKHVLVVDDDPALREALEEVVGDSGFGVHSASNGQEALNLMRQLSDKPCVVLLDVMMPVMDGWGFRSAQMADPSLAPVPVIVLSAHADIVDTATKMGAQAHLKKPVDLTALIDAVRRFC